MRYRQPDRRIQPRDLGMMALNGQRFVINLRPGVPFNACIEEFDGSLRCWASYKQLTQEAADLVARHATQTKSGAFLWNDDVRRDRFRCHKGDHDLFQVVFP